MERPVMNPLFMEGITPPPPRLSLARRMLQAAMGLLQFMLFTDLLNWRRRVQLRIEDGSAIARALRGILYRLLFLPVAIVLVVAVLVYIGTHPPRLNVSMDPLSLGYYYEPLSMASADGTRLEGWLIPFVDAHKIIRERETILLKKQPAVVLIHDCTGNQTQMLPLVRPLHEAGYVVLVLGLRGSGANPGATTFGLREAEDVRAAVDLLRRRNGVDPDRITLLGVGTGANAAILAAGRDNRIASVILDHPTASTDELVQTHLSPPQPWLKCLRPLCRWTFEIAYKVNAQDIDLERCKGMLESRPILILDSMTQISTCLHGNGLSDVQRFLARHTSNDGNDTTASTDPR